MACGGCAAARAAREAAKNVTYVYTAQDGSTKVYRDKREADAAVIRRGGSYVVKK